MTKLVFSTLILILVCSISAASAGESWFRNISQGNEKVVELHFYVQDVRGGPNQTASEVARASVSSNSTSFGVVDVVDDLLTAGPDKNSEKVGRAQGLVTYADMETTALAMNVNFVFTTGKYNGSTVSILGRNLVPAQERELPVVGGTGVFRFTRGYAITRTYSYDVEADYLVLEYTLYVTSYVDA